MVGVLGQGEGRHTSEDFPEANQCPGTTDSLQGPAALRGTQWGPGRLGLVATPWWRTAVVHLSSREGLGKQQQRVALLCLITQAVLRGKKPEDSPMPFCCFGRREATSAGMMVEAAFRVIFRDWLLHSNGILSSRSGGWSSCLAGQSFFGYWEQDLNLGQGGSLVCRREEMQQGILSELK